MCVILCFSPLLCRVRVYVCVCFSRPIAHGQLSVLCSLTVQLSVNRYCL